MRRMVVLLTILSAFAFGYVLLSEDFNSDWTANSPPAGWRIFHSDTLVQGTDDWHREEPYSATWPTRDSRYAALYWNASADAPPDSLVTPVVNCSGYENIRLSVTTRFVHNGPNPYFAQLWYSLDGGTTFNQLVHNYETETIDSTTEVYSLGFATNQPQVVLAWVFDGNLQDIQWWCIDDVTVEGDSILPYDVLLSEDFNSDWTTNSPPAGWRIYHSNVGVEGSDDWHREEPGSAAWPSRDSRYAAIYWNLAADAPPDSLISPVIDCSGYRNIRLNVTTRFAHNDLNRYFAQLWYSLDGGITFTGLVKNYEFLNIDSTAEVFTLDSAANQAQLVLAWVFDSSLQNIRWWCIDDVSVEGESIPEYDIACDRILSPPGRLIPGDISPSARFVNYGAVDQNDIPVVCELRDEIGTPIQTWTDVILFLGGGGGTADVTFTPPEPVGLGRYSISFWHESPADSNRANDTLHRDIAVSYAEPKYYDGGSDHVYHDWPVGHYGWGAKFGATYPVFIESLQVYLRCPLAPFNRFQLAVVRNDGGAPGDMCFKTPVLEGGDGWNSVSIPTDDNHLFFGPADSFYVFYLQVGETQECPELSNDGQSRPSYAEYWQYRDGSYLPDDGTGNFRIRCWVNKETLASPTVDMRTLYIEQPRYEFVQRPFDAPFAPRALVDNIGTSPVADVPVTCSIFGLGNALRYAAETVIPTLGPGSEVFVEFDSFVPPMAEACSIVVTVAQGNGSVPEPLVNNVKRFGFDVRKGVHTGMSSGNDYAWIDSDTTGGPVFDWVDTAGANVAIAYGDERRILLPINFDFPYGDSTFLYGYVCTNGWFALGANPGTNESLPRPLPEASAPNNVIYPWWDNFAFGPGFGGGKVCFRNLGESPNRRFVIIWQDAWRVRPDGDTSELVTFEAILHENGTVVYQYLDTDAGDPTFNNARYSTIGLEDKLGADGLCYLHARPPMSGAVNDLANRVRPGSAIRFYPIFRDAAALDITNPPEWTFPGSITPEAKIQNYGTVTDSMFVYFKIRDTDPPYEDTVVVPGLLPGDSAFVSFKPWQAELGYYTLTCSTVMYGDVNDSNDVVRKFVAVSPWIQREDIPLGDSRRKVKGAALEYNPDAREVYAMKGGNENTVWRFDLATGSWDSLTSMPLDPSGRRAKYGCDLAYDRNHGTAGRIWAMKAGGTADFYYYDIAADNWVSRKPIYLKVFEYRGPKKGAAIAYAPENSAVYCILGNNTNQFWRYDIAADSWMAAPEIPTDPFLPGRLSFKRANYGADLVYGNGRLYCIKGNNTYEAYGFNPIEGKWSDTLTDTTLITDRRRKRIKAGGSLAWLDSTLYVLKGGNTQQFWKYRVAGESASVWRQLSDIPYSMSGRRRKVKRGSALLGTDSTIVALKGSYTYEFWEYKSGGDSVSLFAGPRPSRSGATAEEGSPVGRLSVSSWPNPTAGGMMVRFEVPTAARARLRIYDHTGRLVRSLRDAPCLPGRHAVRWDGLADNRREVPAGVYFVKLESGGTTVSTKLVVRR